MSYEEFVSHRRVHERKLMMGEIMKARLRVTGLFLSAALLAVTSCGGLKVPGASSTTSSGPGQASADPREALKKAFTAQLAATSYRARVEYSIGGVGTHNDLEFVAPDRYHVTLVGPATMGQEMIIIGKIGRASCRERV